MPRLLRIIVGVVAIGFAGYGAAGSEPMPQPSRPASTQPAQRQGAPGAASRPATTRGLARFPHLLVDVDRRQLRIECETLNVRDPLEFLCVKTGTNEHESVLRSPVEPEHVHLGLLMLGLRPGQMARFDEVRKVWLPPQGPALSISCEVQQDGKTTVTPAYRWLRNIRNKEPMPALTWVFAGSEVADDGLYIANATGYLVTIVNFQYSVIDVPVLASSANETLLWELNTDLVPPVGTRVTMIIEPADEMIVWPLEHAPDHSTTAPADQR
jgi:hypothetical protein